MKFTTVLTFTAYSISLLYLSLPVQSKTLSHLEASPSNILPPYDILEVSNSDDYHPRFASFHLYPIAGTGDLSEELESFEDNHGQGKRGAVAYMGEHMARLRRGAIAFNNDMARLRRSALFSGGDMARLRRAGLMSSGDMARLRRAGIMFSGDMARLRRASIMSGGDMARLRRAGLMFSGDMARLRRAGLMSSGDMARL